MCAGDQTTCESTAQSGECASLIQAANTCISQDSPAEVLCSKADYSNFGDWFAAVGEAYCETGVTPVCN